MGYDTALRAYTAKRIEEIDRARGLRRLIGQTFSWGFPVTITKGLLNMSFKW